MNQKGPDPNLLAVIAFLAFLAILATGLFALHEGGYARLRALIDLPGGQGAIEGEMGRTPALPPAGDTTGSVPQPRNRAIR